MTIVYDVNDDDEKKSSVNSGGTWKQYFVTFVGE